MTDKTPFKLLLSDQAYETLTYRAHQHGYVKSLTSQTTKGLGNYIEFLSTQAFIDTRPTNLIEDSRKRVAVGKSPEWIREGTHRRVRSIFLDPYVPAQLDAKATELGIVSKHNTIPGNTALLLEAYARDLLTTVGVGHSQVIYSHTEQETIDAERIERLERMVKSQLTFSEDYHTSVQDLLDSIFAINEYSDLPTIDEPKIYLYVTADEKHTLAYLCGPFLEPDVGSTKQISDILQMMAMDAILTTRVKEDSDATTTSPSASIYSMHDYLALKLRGLALHYGYYNQAGSNYDKPSPHHLVKAILAGNIGVRASENTQTRQDMGWTETKNLLHCQNEHEPNTPTHLYFVLKETMGCREDRCVYSASVMHAHLWCPTHLYQGQFHYQPAEGKYANG